MEEKLIHTIKSFNPTPCHSLIFYNNDIEIGKLDFSSDTLKFEGNVDESANEFLTFICESFNQKIDKTVDDLVMGKWEELYDSVQKQAQLKKEEEVRIKLEEEKNRNK